MTLRMASPVEKIIVENGLAVGARTSDGMEFTTDDIFHAKPYTPLDISEKLTNMKKGDWMVGRICEENLMGKRPTPLMSQYKTPIEGLYLCGFATHPHGFITFGPGYNALQVIADDFGLDKWWVEI